MYLFFFLHHCELVFFSNRCKHLEEALSEATKCVQDLEATNSSLEKKLVTSSLACIMKSSTEFYFVGFLFIHFYFCNDRLNGQSAMQSPVLL